jgi:UDP-glucose 4-epimerase
MILIYGGSGFLGRHLRTLPLADENFTFVYRVSEPIRLSERETSISAEEFAGPAGDDIIARASAVIYLATRSVPGTFEYDPARELQENVAPALRFFSRCASINPTARIVLASSGGTIYGRVGNELIVETTPAAPISAYGFGKLAIEDGLAFVHRTKGVPYSILRIANPVGRHQRSTIQGIVSVAMKALLEGTRFKVFGNGSSIRDYVDADDVASAILAAARYQDRSEAVWNVGSGVGHTVLEILDLIGEVANRKLEIEFQPARDADVHRIVLNSDLIARELGWRPQRALSSSVESVWRFFLEDQQAVT